jgi:hypothetical protein
MTQVGRYQQVKPVSPPKKPVERKTPLSQPGQFNQQTMEAAKPIMSPNGGRR